MKHLLIIFTVQFVVSLSQDYHVSLQSCPEYCNCFVWGNLPRINCNGKNLLTVEINILGKYLVLDLSNNLISFLEPRIFQKMKLSSLKYLYLQQNHISSIHFTAFEGMKDLKFLDLSDNHLRYINGQTFQALSSLETLYLSGNKLGIKEVNKALHIPSLKVLGLRNCELDHLEITTFYEVPLLENLNLAENELIEIKTSSLEPLMQLKKINISRNPWSCDSDTKLLINWLSKNKIEYAPICGESTAVTKKTEKLVVAPYESPPCIPEYIEDLEGEAETSTVKIPLRSKQSFLDLIPPHWLFIVGIQIGMVLGIIFMWIANNCCVKRSITTPFRRHQALRQHYTSLQSFEIADGCETPPPPYRSAVDRKL